MRGNGLRTHWKGKMETILTHHHSGKPDLKEVPELGQKQARIASDFQIVCMDSGCNLI
jgi:hypothetical protein